MKKELLLALSLSVIVIIAYVVLSLDTGPSPSEVDTAVNQAKYIFRQMKAQGWDFSQGSCLSNALMPDWVLDIAHSPRIALDDLAENQCSAYREGNAKHFVELDTDGNLIRAR